MLIIPLICSATFSLDKWQYYKEISSASGGLVKFSLDDELFLTAKNDLADLRVIDEDNQEVPYKLIVNAAKNKSEIIYPKILNNSFVSGENSSAIIELEEGQKEINRLKINTPSENFQRNVKVYGSDDSMNWNILVDNAYIYDYTDKKANFKSQNTTLNFSLSVFRYIKIEIADSEGIPVKISGIEAVRYVSERATEIARHPHFEITENKEEKVSEVICDLGFSGIPTSAVRLNISDENFNRGVLVYASNNEKDWKFNSNGYIFRYNMNKFTGENLKINFGETNERYLKIIINNKDNQPLKIFDLVTYSFYREVIFQADPGNSYKVYYGNAKADFPEYDLEKYFVYLDLDNVAEVNLSKQKDNNSFVAEKTPEKPFTERIPYLMPSALVLICLVLLFLVYKFFQKK